MGKFSFPKTWMYQHMSSQVSVILVVCDLCCIMCHNSNDILNKLQKLFLTVKVKSREVLPVLLPTMIGIVLPYCLGEQLRCERGWATDGNKVQWHYWKQLRLLAFIERIIIQFLAGEGVSCEPLSNNLQVLWEVVGERIMFKLAGRIGRYTTAPCACLPDMTYSPVCIHFLSNP